MLKKTLFTILAVSIIANGAVFAQTDSGIGILPNNPFYFLKDIGRQIQSFFTFSPVKKAELKLEIADEKLAEIEELVELDNTQNIDEYLDDYKESLEEFNKEASVLVKDSDKTEVILEEVTNNMFEHQEILEKLNVEIDSENVENLKNEVLDIYTNSSLEIASPEKLNLKLEEKALTTNTGQVVLEKIQTSSPTLLQTISNNVEEVLDIPGIISEEELLDRIEQETKALNIEPEEILNEFQNVPEGDLVKIQEFALEILAGNKTQQEILESVKEMELSEETQDSILKLKNTIEQRNGIDIDQQNEILEKCINDGYRIEKQAVSDLAEPTTYCVNNDKKCEILEYYNGECELD